MKHFSRSLAVLFVAAAAVPVHATVVYSDDFDTDHSANWTYVPSTSTGSLGDTANDGIGSDANAYYDYSAVGVPSAPGSAGGSTLGMVMKANLPGTNIFSGVTMALANQSFDFVNKDYKFSAQVWLNYYGGTTSGTTEEVMMGVGGAQGSSQFVGDNFNSVMFSTSTDGDTASDYRAYKTPWPIQGPADTDPGQPAVGRVQQGESGVYASDPTGSVTGAGSGGDLDSANAYYSNLFPAGNSPPAAQQALFSNQVGVTTGAGVVSFAWHTWSIQTTHGGGPITFAIDGNPIATIQGGTVNPYTLAGDDFYFGMYDINTSSPPTGFSADQLLFGLVDNVKIEDTTVTKITGDTNGDGVVDLTDLNNVLNNFGVNASGNPGDDNGDGTVDLTDLNDVLNNFGAHSPAASALSVVPEPATLSLLSLGAVGLLARRRSRRA